MMRRENTHRQRLLGMASLLLGSLCWGSTDIRLNSLGFLPSMPKKAATIKSCSDFTVHQSSDNRVVYAGKTTGPIFQKDVNQDVWIADFSEVKTPGQYYLTIPGVGRSIDFPIGDKVYDSAFYTVMRGFTLWRCGTAVQGEHNGIRYSHVPCHLNDAYQTYIGFGDTIRDGTGGWHDAGDYGKYTVNAGITVGMLFLAWDHFQSRLQSFPLDIPDSAAGWPDFLKEIKWEIDWLLKMQYPDGSGKISHKLTPLDFPGFIMPENDDSRTYFTDWGSAATADFVAMTAMAARYFKPYDAAYAQRCLEASKNSYAFLKANPTDKKPDQKVFSTGGYGTSDSDDRLWAAAELWQTTGDTQVLQDFENQAKTIDNKIEIAWDWSNVRNLAMFTYLLSGREGKNPDIAEDVRRDLLSVADAIVQQARRDVYSRPLGGTYYWGSNGTVARQTLTLQIAYKIDPKPEYRYTALDAISHLFGHNTYGRSFVTGIGYLPPMNPHDRRSGADGIKDPWPGYLVGGGTSAVNWKDSQDDYRTNEIAINWQAALVYALAGFVSQ